MANMTKYLQKKIGDAVISGTAYTLPTGLWLSLHSVLLNDDGSFVNEISIIGSGYARLNIRTFMEVVDLATGISRNDVVIEIGPATSDWGLIASIGFSDAVTGGNMLMWVSPTTPKLINTGQRFEIPVHNLEIRFN